MPGGVILVFENLLRCLPYPVWQIKRQFGKRLVVWIYFLSGEPTD